MDLKTCTCPKKNLSSVYQEITRIVIEGKQNFHVYKIYNVPREGNKILFSFWASSSRPISMRVWYNFRTVASPRWDQSWSSIWVLFIGHNLKFVTWVRVFQLLNEEGFSKKTKFFRNVCADVSQHDFFRPWVEKRNISVTWWKVLYAWKRFVWHLWIIEYTLNMSQCLGSFCVTSKITSTRGLWNICFVK